MDILDEYKFSRNTFLYPTILTSIMTVLPTKFIHKPSAILITGSLISVTAFNQFQYMKMKRVIEGQKSIINVMDI
jgi:hypothetical protein